MFSTPNLDEATYLYLHGHFPMKYHRTGPTSTIFFFRGKVLPLIKTFREGRARVDIVRYMYCRGVIKAILKAEPIEEAKLTYRSFIGKPYWYIVNKTILYAMAGVNNVHLERFEEGNFFVSKEEAQSKLGKT